MGRYLRIGGFPLSTSSANDAQIIDGIYRSLEKVIAVDLVCGKNYETDTLSKVMGIMGLIAASGRISFEKMAATSGLSKPTVIRVVEDLRKAGALIRVDALGSAYDQMRKTPQYRPSTPGLRMAMLWKAGAWRGTESQMGVLLEDAVASTLDHAKQAGMIASFYADDGPDSADFLVQRMDGLRVVMEVSWGRKDRRQARTTAARREAAYAVICAKNPIMVFDEDEMVIEVPRAAMLYDAALSPPIDRRRAHYEE